MIPLDTDKVTAEEINRFIERKCDEALKISGQIARDLNRIGDMAFISPSAYTQLKTKYQRGHAGKKKLAILEMMRNKWCRAD